MQIYYAKEQVVVEVVIHSGLGFGLLLERL